MRSGKVLAGVALLACIGVAGRADLALWVQHQPTGPLLDILLRTVPMPGESVRFRRPPAETRPALTRRIAAEPKNAALYRLRAQEDEMQLDIPAAENDWKAFADLSADRGAGYLELADFYHRRVRAAEEVAALQVVGSLPSDPFLPPAEQRAWMAYARMLPVIKDAGLSTSATADAFRGWIRQYPAEPTARREFIDFLIQQRQYAGAEAQIGAYEQAFPADGAFPTEARARVAAQRDSQEAALRIYDRAFQPLWPKELLDSYFALLDKNMQLREFLAKARVAREKNPGDLYATARLFAYYRHTNNVAAARRVLIEYRLAKESKPASWTPVELKTLAILFDDANEQARMYYALYSLPVSTPGDRETALAGLVDLLLNKADRPIRFGSGDLSLYKDIATVDSSPGFLNGILSLVLNSTSPRWQYEEQNNAAGAYFHRAEGARLLEVFEKQFPASARRSELRSSLIDAYAGYGDDDGAIAAARAYLTGFPRAPQRTHVALALADALARRGRTQEEFAVYREMLAELAARYRGVPLGVHGGGAPAPQPQSELAAQFPFRAAGAPEPGAPGPRSTDYAEVLNKYLARLSALRQPMEALKVYRSELDRNPNDPGLYQRFAGFLEQNNLGADVQDVYRRAIAKFPDKSWYDKLARLYLRGKQQDQFAALTREATGIFSGTELEAYFGSVVQTEPLGPALALQLNLYAHQRFPEDLTFVRNLWNAYTAKATANPTAAAALLHDYWFYDPFLKNLYFEQLYSQGDLLPQIAAAQKSGSDNPAAVQFLAEAEAWLSHLEAAAPGLRATADLFPGSEEKNAAAASLYRSLAAYFPADTQAAADFARKAYDASPSDTKLLETVGDIYSDKEDFTRAAAAWNSIPRVFPGKPDGYLETATVFWDYYRFTDALKPIREARLKYRDKALFAYEAGAIAEGRRDYGEAVREYLAGAEAGNESAERRIVRLASRPAQRDPIDRLTVGANARLRIEVLKAQQRKPELEAFLAKEIAVATQVTAIAPLLDAAREQGFERVERQGLEREIAVTLDPVERIRLRLELVKYLESRKDLDAAAREMDGVARDNPLILGVLRARVDFDKRNRRDRHAVAALTEAAAKARPDLSAQFRLEAARVATGAGKVDEARALLAELLKAEPYSPDYLAALADTYAAANDDAGFIRFAGGEIDALKKAPLPAEDRKVRIAALRRGLMVTLTRRNDYAGAVDQYIEAVNAFPDDAGLAREAALFASGHGRGEQLISFYTKTTAAAPRDWRWPVVLARIETAVEDYPAALKAYDLAMKSRPDRADLVQARAELEVRLLRFEDAIRSYSKLYQLTYNDPAWLDQVAELEARLGRGAEAVATLEKAHIGAGGETVSGLFAIASSLDQWHLSADAARFADRGFALAGNDLAVKYPSEAVTYARIMASVRRNDAILSLDAPDNAVRAAGTTVAELYTPEEKTALAARPKITETLARFAGLEDRLAQLPAQNNARPQWIALQSRRGLYEQIAASAPPQQAALAARRSGNPVLEMRIYAALQAAGTLPALSRDRYLEILMERDPEAFVAQRSDRAIEIATAAGNENLAMLALKARAASLPPVWGNAYSALTGVYFDNRTPDVTQSFLAVLQPRTIGQRLAAKPDPNRALVGSLWFYYGARYGEYLARRGSADADNYLPASLESQPGNPDVYIALGDFERDTKRWPEAIGEYRKALDLDANRGEAHDGIARVLNQQGRRAEAIAEWRESLSAFQREQSRGVRVRDSFWAHAASAIDAISDAKAFAELQPDIHRVLLDYVHRNGGYRFNELVDPALKASFQSNTPLDWLLDVMMGSQGWVGFGRGLNEDQLVQLARFNIAYHQRQAAVATGYEKTRLEQEIVPDSLGLIGRLVHQGKLAEANAEYEKISPADFSQDPQSAAVAEIELAAANGRLDRLIAKYRADPTKAPPFNSLTAAAESLRHGGHTPEALDVLEFAYTRELKDEHLVIANFLGLARVHLERDNQLDRALGVLRRMTLVAGQPFEAFEPAGDVLAEFHHDKEAQEFYVQALQAAPWNAQAKLKLGGTQRLTQIANDSTAPYALRAAAARRLAPAKTAVTGELALLVSGDKSPAAARQPFYVESRIDAASKAPDSTLKLSLLREALAIAPDDGRVRLAAVRAALEAGNDNLALAMYQASTGRPVFDPQAPPEDVVEPVPFELYRPPVSADADLLKALSGAARRIGDMAVAERYLSFDSQNELRALQAEQKRISENKGRQPAVTDKLEQPRIVRERILP